MKKNEVLDSVLDLKIDLDKVYATPSIGNKLNRRLKQFDIFGH
jgi:hypothetical protein